MKIGPLSFLLLIPALLHGAVFEPLNAFRGGPGKPTVGATLVHHTDGFDYGTTQGDGPNGSGTIYRVSAQGTIQMVLANPLRSRIGPEGAIIGFVPDGHGFFWSLSSGFPDAGTISKYNPATGEQIAVARFSYDGAKGTAPAAELYNDGQGFMWGTTTADGDAGHGTIFKVDIVSGELTLVGSFTKGDKAQARLVPDGAGHLWGTTSAGGADDLGTLFNVDMATGLITTVAEFTGDSGVAPGRNPVAALVDDGQGHLWGTTPGARLFGDDRGSLFKVEIASGTYTPVFSFTGVAGAHPGDVSPVPLAYEAPGSLLGIFQAQADFDAQSSFISMPTTVYRIETATGTITPLGSLELEGDEAEPVLPASALVQAGAGRWRVALHTSALSGGRVYEFDTATGQVTRVARLTGALAPPDGIAPEGPLTADGNGFLWGVTPSAGAFNCGSVFKVQIATGEITTVVNFTGTAGSAPGKGPVPGLVLEGGCLWGVTTDGGGEQYGTIFKIEPVAGAFENVSNLSSLFAAALQPSGPLLPDGNGFLLGCSVIGGNGDGSIYRVEAATGYVELLVSFSSSRDAAVTDGRYPQGGLARDHTGSYWGATQEGGVQKKDAAGAFDIGHGTIFKWDPVTGTLRTMVRFTGDTGAVKGDSPPGSLVYDGAGSMLGVCDNNIFKVNVTTGAYRVLATTLGPQAPLVADGKGKFWGMSFYGGTFIAGEIFNLTSAGHLQTAFVFDGDAGDRPAGGLVHVGNAFYGVTERGGVTDTGAVGGGGQIFRLNLDPPPTLPASVAAIVGQPVPNESETNYGALGAPQSGPYAGTLKSGVKTVAAIFAQDGTVRAKVGGGAPGMDGVVLATVGAPNGDAALASLKLDSKLGVQGTNDAVLLTGLTSGPVRIAAREGIELTGLPGVSIKTFVAFDGAPSANATTFVYALLQGKDVNAGNDSALLAIRPGQEVKVLVREGAMVGAKKITGLATLVGVAGTLAEDRWRAGDDAIGVRLSFNDGSSALYTVPGSAVTPADWTRWLGLGDILDTPLKDAQVTALSLPGFGTTDPAAVATLKVGVGGVTKADATAVVRVASGELVVLARQGDFVPDRNNLQPFELRRFGAFSAPISGANGRTAFFATVADLPPALGRGIWFADDGVHLAEVASVGADAPGGGRFLSFTQLALPNGPTSGPVFTAKLLIDPVQEISAANNTGFYAVDSTNRLRLVLRTGSKVVVQGTPKVVRTFTALTATAGSIGAAQGFDAAGHLAVLATFTDATVALLELTVP